MDPGAQIGPYEIVRPLGAGGMGEVYLAKDTRLGRRVALKFLPADAPGDALAAKRLVREAKTAAALDHPYICKIYEVDEDDGRHFIAMEYVRGRTLADRLGEKELPLAEALRYAGEILEALDVAHREGVVHRDIKPHNVMLTDDGHVKVMDFGLALRAGSSDRSLSESEAVTRLTRQEVTPGTPAYMAPEQLRGEELDAQADLFSFGIVLYEMLVGEHPFRHKTGTQTARAVLTDDPPDPAELRHGLSPELRSLLQGLLAKDPARRIGTASAARRVVEEARVAAGPAGLADVARFLGRPSIAIVVLLVVVGTVAFGTWRYRASQRRATALELLPRIGELAEDQRYAEAYDLAVRAEGVLGDHPRLEELWPRIADHVSVDSRPPGARVQLQRHLPGTEDEPPPFDAGATPIKNLRVARVDHRMVVTRPDFLPVERMISSKLARRMSEWRPQLGTTLEFDVELAASSDAPRGTVFVPGGAYSLVSTDVQSQEVVELADYYIDRYEVSNQQFRQFVLAGGYTETSYWKTPFVDGGRELEFDEAMARFRDRSGLAGPRSWTNQRFPEGTADHPVTGVSWYEAAAYCEFAGKRLPTLYEWEKAAVAGGRGGLGLNMPWGLHHFGETEPLRANLLGQATEPIDSRPFGVSPYGAHQMAGNAAEWCLNPRGDGYEVAGGSWADPLYVFVSGGTLMPPFAATEAIGFRCATAKGVEPGAQGAGPVGGEPEIMETTPVTEAEFRSFLSHYRYDRDPVEETLLEGVETEDWVREKLSLDYGAEEAILAYLYLPKRALAPYQTIFYGVSSSAFTGMKVSTQVEAVLGPQLRAGRAVFAVAPKGSVERSPWPGFADPPAGHDQEESVAYRDEWTLFVREWRIALDYLATRDDIDAEKVVYGGLSLGAEMGLLLPAVDDRFSAVLLIGAGIPADAARMLPEVNPVNFAPRIRGPKLIVQGRYDQTFPVASALARLVELLPEPKVVEIVDGPHLPPIEERSPIINGWLDETLGPPTR